MSGKDTSKVDRSGAYMARKIARDIVLAGYAEKCEVQIAYAIGVAEPVSVYVETFGTEHQDKRFIEQYVRDSYDLMNNPGRNPSPVRRMEITNPFCWKSRFR